MKNLLKLIYREHARLNRERAKLQHELAEITKAKAALSAAREALAGKAVSAEGIAIVKPAKVKRHISKAGRAAMAAAQRKRWSKYHARKKAA